MSTPPAYSAPHAPMLLEVVREHIRAKHFSRRTEQSYTGWIKRFVHFYHKKHPRDMGAPEVEAFLTDLGIPIGDRPRFKNPRQAAPSLFLQI